MNYRIGGHRVTVTVEEEGDAALDALLPSFVPFKAGACDDAPPLFRLSLTRRLKRVPEADRRLITDADTGNGITRVERTADGGYQFTVGNVAGSPCALLITSPDYADCRCALRGSESDRRFGLNSVLMLLYAFSGAYRDTLLVHASVVRHAGRAYAFTAESGTGKSTHVANWLWNIEGCDLVNDDNPILRIIDGQPFLFGSPWSGKTTCYRNIQVPLGAVLKIERDSRNHVEPMSPVNAFATLLAACSAIRTDETLYGSLCGTVSALVGKTVMATLHCLPDAESAFVCRQFLEE